MSYFKSYFVWKLSPASGPQLSSELFRHYIAYNYRLYQEKENVAGGGASTKTNDVEKVLINTLKETLATIEGGIDGKKPKVTRYSHPPTHSLTHSPTHPHQSS